MVVDGWGSVIDVCGSVVNGLWLGNRCIGGWVAVHVSGFVVENLVGVFCSAIDGCDAVVDVRDVDVE